MSVLTEEQRAAESMTVLVDSSMNLWMEQFETLQGGVYRLWRSAAWLSLNLELICLAVMGSLLTFVSSLFIREEVLNFPSCIFLMASATGFESARMRMGCLDSLNKLYSACIAVATLRPSISQGSHFRHWSLSLEE